MSVKFSAFSLHKVITLLIVCLSLIGCKQNTDYEALIFELGKDINALDAEKLNCAILVISPNLSNGPPSAQFNELYYLLMRDVSIPYASAQIEGDYDQLYIPSYKPCDEPLRITKEIVRNSGLSENVIVTISEPEELLEARTFLKLDKTK